MLGKQNPFSIVTKAVQESTMMGEDKFTIEVIANAVIPFSLLDYVTVYGKKYIMYEAAEVERTSDNRIKYTCVYRGAIHQLARAMFMHDDPSGINFGSTFSYMASLSGFIDLLIINMNRVYSGSWQKGSVPSTTAKNLDFGEETCEDVLSRLMEEYNMEFYITEVYGLYTLYVAARIGNSLTDQFRLGQSKATTKITRGNKSEDYVTRLYAFGADKNLGSNYRNYASRLKLPVSSAGGERSYIEDTNQISAFGVVEKVKYFDDIFPRRQGYVSSLGSDIYTFFDASIDFDVNAYMISGVAPKIHFNTGNLAGYEFTLKSYDAVTRKFIINSVQDEKGLLVPNTSSAFRMGIGDAYVILDITLPASYITNAENELLTAAQAWLNDHKYLISTYGCEIDEKYFINHPPQRSVNQWFTPGDSVWLIDDSIGGGIYTRITSLTRDYFKKERYTFTFGDYVYKKRSTRSTQSLRNISNIVTQTAMASPGSRRLLNYNNMVNDQTNSQM